MNDPDQWTWLSSAEDLYYTNTMKEEKEDHNFFALMAIGVSLARIADALEGKTE